MEQEVSGTDAIALIKLHIQMVFVDAQMENKCSLHLVKYQYPV